MNKISKEYSKGETMIYINENGIKGYCKAKDFKKQIQKLKDLTEAEKWIVRNVKLN